MRKELNNTSYRTIIQVAVDFKAISVPNLRAANSRLTIELENYKISVCFTPRFKIEDE